MPRWGWRLRCARGADGDPNIYHEYTDRGGEEEVPRERYDLVLQPRWRAGLLRDPRPGMRASITYDSDNWSFWSLPFAEPGQTLGLKGGDPFPVAGLHSKARTFPHSCGSTRCG